MPTGPPSTGSSSSGGPPSRVIQFKCVKCGQAIRVGHPSSPVQVKCPKCELPFAVLPDGQIIRQDSSSAFDNLPPAMVTNVAPPRAKGFQADAIRPSPVAEESVPGGRVYRPIRPRTKGQSASAAKLVKRIIGVAVAICFACLTVGAIWYAAGKVDPDDAITRVMASMEKPGELWGEVISNGTVAADAMNELVADQELDRQALNTRVIVGWDRSRSKLAGLRKRATYLKPMTQSQLDGYLKRIERVTETFSDTSDDMSVSVSLSPETLESWLRYQEEYKKTILRISNLSSPMPEGDDLKAKVARQATEIERELYVKAARREPDDSQDSVEDRKWLEESVAAAVLKYQDIADKLDGRLSATPIADDPEIFDLTRRLNYRNLYPASKDGSSEIEEALRDIRIDVLGSDL